MKETIQNIQTYIEANLESLVYIFPLGFILWGSFVLFVISRFGWNKFAYKYESETPLNLARIGIASVKVGMINYNNSFTLSCNNLGLFLKPLLLFRMGHQPIFIPFKDIKSIEDKKRFGFSFISISYQDDNLPDLAFDKKTWHKIESLSGFQFS
jgi:hypothetical protein